MSGEPIAMKIAELLEGGSFGVVPGTYERLVKGRRHGLHVEVRCTWSSDIHTWSVEIKGAGPLVLATAHRRSIGEGSAIASGAITDVGSGDATFDREWLVEGAPAATTRLVFGEEAVRQKLGAIPKSYFEVDGGDVRVGGKGHYEVADVKNGIEAAVALRLRLT